jgi:hypothetical protein
MLKSKLLKKWTKSWKAHLKLLFMLLMCRKAKYILQKSTPKIKQLAIQLAISQFFQKFKSRSTNKQGMSRLWAPYCLKPIERKEILNWLKTFKFPEHYVANIKWAVNVGIDKLNGPKSHDNHIIIERQMPVIFHGYFKAICEWSLLNSVTSVGRFMLDKSQRQWCNSWRRKSWYLYVRWKNYFCLDGSKWCNIC